MAVSPSARTKRLLEKEGWPLIDTVERFIPKVRIRKDMFGFIDMVAFHPDRGWLLIQVTTGSNVSERQKKIREHHSDKVDWLTSQPYNRIEIHGWRKVKGGKKRATWQCRRIKVVGTATGVIFVPQ